MAIRFWGFSAIDRFLKIWCHFVECPLLEVSLYSSCHGQSFNPIDSGCGQT